MANTFATLQEIARRALPVLCDSLVFPQLIHRDFGLDGHGRGDTVRILKPVKYTAEDFDESQGVNFQDIVEDTVPVTLDHIATVDARASAIEAATSIDDLDRLFILPAAAAIAEKINADGLALYKDVYTYVGEAGVTPGSLSVISDARKALNNAKAPGGGRCAVWSVEADAAFTTIDALVNAEKAGTNRALREGSIGRVFGLSNYMSQAVYEHKTGITAATNVKTDGLTIEGASRISLKGSALTGRLVKGDIISVNGKSYVVTADSQAASNNAISNVRISPAASEIPDGTAVTLIGSHTANLAFHPLAFAYVTRPLNNPDGQGVESYVTSYNGISLRVTRGYDQSYKRSVYSMDVLYGFKTVYPELALRVLG